MTSSQWWLFILVLVVLMGISMLPLLTRPGSSPPGGQRDAFLPVRSADHTLTGVPVYVVSLVDILSVHPPERAVVHFDHRGRRLRYIPESGVAEPIVDYRQVECLTLSVRLLPGEDQPCFLSLVVIRRPGQAVLRMAHGERVPHAATEGVRVQLQALASDAGLALHVEEDSALS